MNALAGRAARWMRPIWTCLLGVALWAQAPPLGAHGVRLPDDERGQAPRALFVVRHDDPRSLTGAWIQATLPIAGTIESAEIERGWVARRVEHGALTETPYLAQLDVFARGPASSAGPDPQRKPQAVLCAVDTPLTAGENWFALYPKTPREAASATALTAPALTLAGALRELEVRCIGPLGEVYAARPLEKARLDSAGPVLWRGEGWAVARTSDGDAGPDAQSLLPHGPLVRGYFELKRSGDLARLELVLCNGFTAQSDDGDFGRAESFDPRLASATTYLRSVEIVFPDRIALSSEGPDRRIEALSADELRGPAGSTHLAWLGLREPNEWLALAPGAFIARAFVASSSAGAARGELARRAAAQTIGVAAPAYDAREHELPSWRTHALLAGIPVSARHPRGLTPAALEQEQRRALADRLAQSQATGGEGRYMLFGGLELQRSTLYGTSTGGEDIGSAPAELYDLVRSPSSAALRLLNVRWRDLSDRADCVWFNLHPDSERCGEPWLATHGLADPSSRAGYRPVRGLPLNFDVAPEPVLANGYFDFHRRAFEALPAYQEHLARRGELGERSRWLAENKFPHDWQHAARYWPAFGAAWILGSPSARTFCRALALSALQARNPVPRAAASEASPYGEPATWFTLLAAKHRLHHWGAGHGGSGAGRGLAWILWCQTNALALIEREDEFTALERNLREEIAVIAATMIRKLGVCEVFAPEDKWTFPLEDGSRSVRAWYVQPWQMGLTAYGLLGAREWFARSAAPGDDERVQAATKSALELAHFALDSAWPLEHKEPFTHYALASEDAPVSPTRRGQVESWPELRAPLFFGRGAERRQIVRGFGADHFYAMDLAAFLHAEGGDVLPLARLSGFDRSYGESFAQLWAWLGEAGRLEPR